MKYESNFEVIATTKRYFELQEWACFSKQKKQNGIIFCGKDDEISIT